MQPQNSSSINQMKQDNPNECPRCFNSMSPSRPSITSQQKRQLQQNMTPFTKYSKLLSDSPFKEVSQEIQKYKDIEPDKIKKQKLNCYQTPSPKMNKLENQSVDIQQRLDIQPFLQLTAHKVMQNLELNDEQTGNKNITYIKIKSPIINLNYSKVSDLEDELNINKCLENTNSIITLNNLKSQNNDQSQQQQQQQQQLNNPDLSNVVYEFKFIQNKNNKTQQKKEQNSVDDDDDEDIYSYANDDDDDYIDEYYLYDTAQQQQQQQQQPENSQIEEIKGMNKEIQTAKKYQDNNNHNNNDTFGSEHYNSQSKRENKLQNFQQFETPKQVRGRKLSKLSNNYSFSEQNPLKTKQQQQLQKNQQIKLNQLQTQINDQSINQSVEKKRIGCNCKKSRCLKLYCDCFANGLCCTSECNCYDCANKEDNQEERNNVMLQLMERNPCAFKPKVDKIETNYQEEQHVRGCNCTKSGCIKKYCECFQAGVKCTSLCKCQNCQNKDESVNQMDN